MKTLFFTRSSARPFSRTLFASRLTWVFIIIILCGVIFGLRFWLGTKQAVFHTTKSPQNTYSVSLKGDKGRPLIIPSQVSADVIKLGQPFIDDIWLHSTADLFDLSFEAGFPEVRWLGESTLEFYRPQYFEKGADSVVISNRARSSIKYLRIQSENKFLIFDLQPGASVSLVIPAPRGDWQTIALQGTFSEGREIRFNSETFDRKFTQRKRSLYQIFIYESGSSIASR